MERNLPSCLPGCCSWRPWR
uniref:Uncharacterized protein n=1 Tax=Zea mays TaxID=4577 RepID=C4J2Z6_MAIZE|nr:unknown [Zea mays]